MKTLIVKLGALGDVVRTTCLLRGIEGEIDWLSKSSSSELLTSHRISNKYFFDRPTDLDILRRNKYNLILSLDEEKKVLEFVRKIPCDALVGIYLNREDKIDYTPEANYWCGMSRISKFGKEVADELKKKNTHSVPEILYSMIGKKFLGQEYDIGVEPKDSIRGRVGLVTIETGVWPTKLWTRYSEFSNLLTEKGFEPYPLKIRKSLTEHIDDINSCEAIVCGDTLGMHLALALKKPVVALFTCTPEAEIETYGRMEKIVSPLCNQYLYDKKYHLDAASSISTKEVFEALTKLIGKAPK